MTSLFIGDSLRSLTVTHYLNAEAAEASITLEDREGYYLSLFNAGQEFQITGGYLPDDLEYFGTYIMDEYQVEGPPDVLNVRGIVADIVKQSPLRTKISDAWEEVPLSTVIGTIAGRNGLRAVISGRASSIFFERLDQKEESDLQMLKRMAKEWGFLVSIEDNVLYFIDIAEKEAEGSRFTITRGDNRVLRRWDMKGKTHKTYRSCQVRYKDPTDKEYKTATVTDPNIENNQTLLITIRAENEGQARERAWAELKERNRPQVEGTVETVGLPKIRAGQNFTLAGFLNDLDGKYQITKARHEWRPSGYILGMDVVML